MCRYCLLTHSVGEHVRGSYQQVRDCHRIGNVAQEAESACYLPVQSLTISMCHLQNGDDTIIDDDLKTCLIR